VQSYVTVDKNYCIYLAPSEQLIRQHAEESGFPANAISEVKAVNRANRFRVTTRLALAKRFGSDSSTKQIDKKMGDISMKRLTLLVITLFSLGLAGSVQAADRVWEDGSVWSITYAQTKPGQFNAYMEDLNKVWRVFTEREMQDGDILSYRVLQVPTPRDGEPNVMFLVEYRNWAAFDKGVEYFDKLSAEIMGSTEKSDAASIDREALRTLRGGLTAQEVKFK
jgi:hypothetical protein